MADDSVLLGELAEEFTQRARAGQLPEVDDYARRHPALAERIRALFPTLMLLEGLAGGGGAPAGPASLEQGSTFGAYRIVREIGRGGMGVVYEAFHQALHRHVALKVLPVQGPAAGPIERFLREARLAAGLHHTNIVPVFDVGQVGGVPYYAMQYIDGTGLDHRREPTDLDRTVAETACGLAPSGGVDAKPQAVSWRFVAEVGIQAAEALAYAHERGVIHRDIKPSNLLLDAKGVVWITDFGLARRLDDVNLTHSGVLLGTPRYMSPEQAEAARKPVDHRTDIYSLGATLYELVTRRPAFDGRTPQEVVSKIIERSPISPRKLNPNVPRDLETIVMKSMAKAPSDRYASAADLAADLRRFLNVEPIRARRIGPVGHFTRWCRRNPRLAAVSMSSLVIIVTLLTIYFVESHHQVNEIMRALGREQAALTQSRENEELSRQRLIRQYVANGQRFVDRHEPLGGLPWFVEALALETDPASQIVHRRRIGLMLRNNPRLEHLLRHGEAISASVFSPDGRWIATGGRGMDHKTGEVQIWDTFTGAAAAPVLKHDTQPDASYGDVTRLVFSRDGKRLVSANNITVCVWDLATQKRLASWRIPNATQYASVTALQFDREAMRVLVGWDRGTGRDAAAAEARVFDAATGKPITPVLLHVEGDNVSGHAQFSPDESLVVMAASQANADGIKMWDMSGKSVRTLHGGGAPAVAFSADGLRMLGLVSDDELGMWDTKSWKPVGPRFRHKDWIVSLQFSPRGNRVLVVERGTARVFDVETGNELHTFVDPVDVIAAGQFSPDGLTLLTATEAGSFRIWDATSSKPLTPDIRMGYSLAAKISPDGQRVLVHDGRVARVWDLAPTGPAEVLDEIGWTIHGPRQVLDYSPSAVYSGDGQRVVLANVGRPIEVRDSMNGRLVTSLERSGDIGNMAFDASGQFLIAISQASRIGGGIDYRLLAYDVAAGRLASELTGHDAMSVTASHAATGRVAWGIYDQKRGVTPLTVRDMKAKRNLWKIELPGVHRPHDFSPSGKLLVTSVAGEEVTIRNAETGEPVASRKLKGDINEIIFRPDEKQLIVLRMWVNGLYSDSIVSIGIGEADRDLPIRRANRVYFAPDSRRIATVDSDSFIRIWDAVTGRPLIPPIKNTRGYARIAFSPDGRLLIAFRVDEPNAIWDAATGEPIALAVGGRTGPVALRSDGETIVASEVVHYGSARYALYSYSIAADQRPIEELRTLAELLSGHRIDDTGGYVPLESGEYGERWNRRPASDPRDARLWTRDEARRAESAGDWPTAARLLDDLIAANSKSWGLFARRGWARFQQRQWDNAIADFNRALELGGPAAPIRFDRGNALAEQGKFDEAYGDFVYAAASPQLVEAGARPALAKLAAGDVAGYRDLRPALLKPYAANDPQLSWPDESVWALALPSDLDTKDIAPVAKHVLTGIGVFPQDAESLLLAAIVRLRSGDLPGADQALADARKRDAFDTVLADLLTSILRRKQGKVEDAKLALAAAIASLEKPGRGPDSWDQRLCIRMLRKEAERNLP